MIGLLAVTIWFDRFSHSEFRSYTSFTKSELRCNVLYDENIKLIVFRRKKISVSNIHSRKMSTGSHRT